MIEQLQRSGAVVGMWIQHPFDVERYGRVLRDLGVPWMGSDEVWRWRLPSEAPRVLETLEQVLEAVAWDTVVVSFPDLAAATIPTIRRIRPAAAVVVDSPDLHFLREERGRLLGITAGDTGKEQELAVYRSSDGVVTASDVEAAVLDEEIPSVPALSFPVAAEEPKITDRGPGRNALFLGNFAHTPNLDGMMWWLDEIQPRVRDLLGEEFTVRVVGSGSEQHAGEWGRRTDVVGWVPDLADEFDATRVFVVPLRFGAGTKGKITVALAHGVPVVTTPIGAEGFGDPILGALRVCGTAEEFAAAVAELMSDDEAWAEARSGTVAAAWAAWERQQDLGVGLASWMERRRPLGLEAERRSGASR